MARCGRLVGGAAVWSTSSLSSIRWHDLPSLYLCLLSLSRVSWAPLLIVLLAKPCPFSAAEQGYEYVNQTAVFGALPANGTGQSTGTTENYTCAKTLLDQPLLDYRILVVQCPLPPPPSSSYQDNLTNCQGGVVSACSSAGTLGVLDPDLGFAGDPQHTLIPAWRWPVAQVVGFPDAQCSNASTPGALAFLKLKAGVCILGLVQAEAAETGVTLLPMCAQALALTLPNNICTPLPISHPSALFPASVQSLLAYSLTPSYYYVVQVALQNSTCIPHAIHVANRTVDSSRGMFQKESECGEYESSQTLACGIPEGCGDSPSSSIFSAMPPPYYVLVQEFQDSACSSLMSSSIAFAPGFCDRSAEGDALTLWVSGPDVVVSSGSCGPQPPPSNLSYPQGTCLKLKAALWISYKSSNINVGDPRDTFVTFSLGVQGSPGAPPPPPKSSRGRAPGQGVIAACCALLPLLLALVLPFVTMHL